MEHLKIPKRVPECGRKTLITWVNSKLCTHFSDVIYLSNGVAYCRLINLIHPGTITGKKIKLDPSPTGYLFNYKLLQDAFYVLKVDKVIPVEQLIASNHRALITFTCWIKIFFEINASPYSCVTNVSSDNQQNKSNNVKKYSKASAASRLQRKEKTEAQTNLPNGDKKYKWAKELESNKYDFSLNDSSINYFLYPISEDILPTNSENVRNQIPYLFQEEGECEFKLESISNVSLREFDALEAILESSHCTEPSASSTCYKLDPQKESPSKMFQTEFSFNETFDEWFDKELNVRGGENNVDDKIHKTKFALPAIKKDDVPPIKLFAQPSIDPKTYMQGSIFNESHHNDEYCSQENATPDFQNKLQHLLENQRSSPSEVTEQQFTDTKLLTSLTFALDEPQEVLYSPSSASNAINMKIDRFNDTLIEGLSSISTKSHLQLDRSSSAVLEGELLQTTNFLEEEFERTLGSSELVATGTGEHYESSDNNDYDERLAEYIADRKEYNLLKLEDENDTDILKAEENICDLDLVKPIKKNLSSFDLLKDI